MTAAKYLDLDSILLIIGRLGVGPVRDAGLLASALGRPGVTLFGDGAYPTMPLKAAALLQSIAGNHPLVDGNKRLAWTAAVVFLDINDLEPALSQDEVYDLMLEVAAGLSDVEVIAERLRVVPRRC